MTQLKCFVYGTLKQGGRNSSLLRGAREVLKGTVRGNIYNYPNGSFPISVIPIKDILFSASESIRNDIQALTLMDEKEEEYKKAILYASNPLFGRKIQGEIVIFEDILESLISRVENLDYLEGYRPKDNSSGLGYFRKACYSEDEEGKIHTVFIYVSEKEMNGPIESGSWPE